MWSLCVLPTYKGNYKDANLEFNSLKKNPPAHVCVCVHLCVHVFEGILEVFTML